MKKIIAVIIALVTVLSLAACGTAQTSQSAATTVTDGQTVGEGAVSFPLTIVDKEGNAITITVKTDEKTVGEALLENGIVEGEDGEYGLYITHVNGIAAIYEEDATYWGFYINGEYALSGVDSTPITQGESYTLKVDS